jgi:hypothetical protein
MDSNKKKSALAIATCAFLLLGGCGGAVQYRDVPGLSFLTYVTVGSVTYAVGRDGRQDNLFYVKTRSGNAGDPSEMQTAVRSVYRCHATRILWLSKDGSSARLNGSFCNPR